MVANRGALSGLAVPPHPAGSLLLHSRLTATANMPKPNDGGCFLRPLSMPTLSLGGFTSCRGFFRLVAASCRQAMVGPLCRYAAPRLRIARPIVQTCLECASPKHIHLACPTLSLSRSLILSGLFSLDPPRLLKLAIRLVKAHSFVDHGQGHKAMSLRSIFKRRAISPATQVRDRRRSMPTPSRIDRRRTAETKKRRRSEASILRGRPVPCRPAAFRPPRLLRDGSNSDFQLGQR